MKILAIDTSSRTGSIGLSDGLEIISERILNVEATHSETLLLTLQNMLDEAGLLLNKVDLIALTLGPGSFTGIRIGVSTVKGLALALGRPVAGVSTLEALAYNFPYARFTIRPVMDARRGEVYTAAFKWDNSGLKRLSDDSAVSPESMVEGIDEQVLFAGEGIKRYGPLINERLGALAVFAPPEYGYIRASAVARIALRNYKEGKTLDISTFTPVYLRRSEAEIKREKGLPGGVKGQ